MERLDRLIELFSDSRKTQYMKQSVNLAALKYLRIKDSLFMHSYFERSEQGSKNPLFSAPAILVEATGEGSRLELTIKTLKDEYDHEALELVRGMEPDQIEVAYSHLSQDLLSPRIKDGAWDNWVFAYSVPQDQKLSLRRKRTRATAAKLYRGLGGLTFEGKKLLFLGCGDGDEIETLITYFNIKSCEIWGIEQSKTGLENSRELSGKYPGINFEFKLIDFKEINQLKGEKFDHVFALGVIDRETLEVEAAKDLLKALPQNISFETLATAAYHFEPLTSDDYRSLGYAVGASCIPATMYTNDYSFFYLLSPQKAAS